MAPNARHVASGIDAVIDSAFVASQRDIWVDVEDVPEAIRQIRKIVEATGGSPVYRPEVYPQQGSDRAVCLRLPR